MVTRKCPHCGRVGQIRLERIFKATERRTGYSCAACGSTWMTAQRPDRRPPKRKLWFA